MNLARCSWNCKNGCFKSKKTWDLTTDEFLDLPQHILEFATTEEHNKQEILAVGRSGCGLSINMKYVGKGMNAAENSGYFPACSAVMMLKIEARSVCTRMRGCSLTPARNIRKKKSFLS